MKQGQSSVVKQLPSMCKTLGSIPITASKQKQNGKEKKVDLELETCSRGKLYYEISYSFKRNRFMQETLSLIIRCNYQEKLSIL